VRIGASPFVNWVTNVQEKGEDSGTPGGGGGDSSSSGQNPEKKEERSAQETPRVEATESDVIAAIEKFQNDAQQTSGLKAEAEGHGPGLRVVLKDVNGSVVRQFSGEEFVRLRDTSSQDGRKRGRLLDKKY
jgi:hypothetical protein